MAPTARQTLRFARGLRRLVRHPVAPEVARVTVADEVATRDDRFLRALDTLVLPFPRSPVRRLLDHAGAGRGDVARLVHDEGLEGALGRLRDEGVYVSYEEYTGRRPAVRGSASFSFSPPDFFNPCTVADYLATTGGSRSTGTPVELSFGYERRQAVLRSLGYQASGTLGQPSAIWLPVFPSAAGFGAVIKAMGGGSRPERWFSQVPNRTAGVSAHKQQFNTLLPVLNALARTRIPLPEHVPTSDPDTVVDWLADALRRAGRATIAGYASSITAAARRAAERGVDLTGVTAYPASEPVTTAKLDTMRAAGMAPWPLYAFVPEGAIGMACPALPDEQYHLWDHDLAVVPRRRRREDGMEVEAFCWTSLSLEAPRVLLNVENDDYGEVRRDEDPCTCLLGAVGVRTRLDGIRGLSKVVAAGISVDGEVFDRITDEALPARVGGGPGDFQFVEEEQEDGGAVVHLRISPELGPVDEDVALAAVTSVLGETDNGALATTVWGPAGTLRVVRAAPLQTKAGKTLSYERRTPAQFAGARPEGDR
jgi:hypothetical protein